VASLFVDFLGDIDVLASVDTGDFHLVKGKGTSLVGADVVCTAHDFTRGKTLDVIVIFKHLRDRVSKGNHDCERETLRHSDHNNGNTHNKV